MVFRSLAEMFIASPERIVTGLMLTESASPSMDETEIALGDAATTIGVVEDDEILVELEVFSPLIQPSSNNRLRLNNKNRCLNFCITPSLSHEKAFGVKTRLKFIMSSTIPFTD